MKNESEQEKLLEETIANTESPNESAWKKWVGFCLRYILPIAFTVLLLVYLFHIVDFRKMMRLLEHGVDYWWILLAMVISVFSHMFRAARWQLQLRALHFQIPFITVCCSIFGCYALNLVIPRLGEIWRCTYISSFKKNSFIPVLGSMFVDRAADVPAVIVLIILTLIVSSTALQIFLEKYSVGRDFIELISQFWFWATIVGGIILIIGLFLIFRNHPFMEKIKRTALNLWKGITVIATMKGKWKFIIFTCCIWGCYYIQLYVAFYAFSFTRELCHTPGLGAGLSPCLVAFVLSSISMVIPSNGGLGPWNLAIMFALAIYGISDAEGTAFSMVQWTGNTIMMILLGIFTMVYISVSSKSKNKNISTVNN